MGDGGTQKTDASGNPIVTAGGAFLSDTGVYRGDEIDTKTAAALADGTTNAGYVAFSTDNRFNPGYLTYDYCSAQRWYDNFVYSPAGHPDVVYVLGGVQLRLPGAEQLAHRPPSDDAGAHWYDQTADKTAGDEPRTGSTPTSTHW